MKKISLCVCAVAIIAVIVIDVNLVLNSEQQDADLTLANIILAQGENGSGENGNKDDEMNAPSAVVCLDGRRIECTICMKGSVDCSPSCSGDLCK